MKNIISFGTDGVRGMVGQPPFTSEGLAAFSWAIANWALNKYPNKSPKVLIGYDTRLSGPEIKKILVDTLAKNSIQVVDGGILPTPAIYSLISKDNSFDFGITISASHNPYQDNGIKLFDAKKCKLDRRDEQKIEENFSFYAKNSNQATTKFKKKAIFWHKAADAYANYIYSQFSPNFLAGLTIVLDCAHGATFQIAPTLFEQFGAKVIKIGVQPDGKNINKNCGSMHPEQLKQTVLQHNADIGFAFDGDGDRLLIVNKTGVIKDGDDTLMLLLQHPAYKKVQNLVSTITANQGLEAELTKMGKKLIRTQVGDKYVAAALEENNLILGGETSGHIIIKVYMITGDGIFAALKTLESIIFNKNWELETFKKYPQVSVNIPVKIKRDLLQSPYRDIIKRCEESIKDGRIVVRYSGTENLLRIMAEASTDLVARSAANELAKSLQEALSE
jgi:phosphoglucosamine mutase